MMFTIGREGQSRLDILGGEFREIREDLVIAHAGRQPAKNIIHRDPHVSNTGLSTTFAGFDRDALAIMVRRHASKVVRFKRVAKREVDCETGCMRAIQKVGGANPTRRAHFPAEWRCECEGGEKTKNSLRRKKVKWADRAGSALPG